MAGIQLKVESDDGAQPEGAGDLTIAVGSGAKITLIPDPADQNPKLLRDGADISASTPLTDGKWVLEGNLDGSYQAKSGNDASNTVTVTVKPPEKAGGNSNDSVAEVEPGQYDRNFAVWVGVVFLVLAGLVLLALGILINSDLLQPLKDKPDFASQTVVATALFALAIGGVVLLAGGALAALECRGRLTSTDEPRPAVRAGGPGVDVEKAFAGAAKVMSEARLLRGTALLVVAGTAIVLFSIIVVSCDGPEGDSTPSPSSSADPSGSPAATQSPASDPGPGPSPTPAG